MLIVPGFPAIIANLFLANRTPQTRLVGFLSPLCRPTHLSLLSVAHPTVITAFLNINPLLHVFARLLEEGGDDLLLLGGGKGDDGGNR